jgi:hypothetical protein
MVPLPGAKRPLSKVSLWVEAGSQAFWSALSRFALRPQAGDTQAPADLWANTEPPPAVARLARVRPRRR